ncbi:MAG TPA: hypothetical protein VKP65_18740 [Rhodothermales bacterium]|nr:hypothetical protein [Rhodothermales bacterium]
MTTVYCPLLIFGGVLLVFATRPVYAQSATTSVSYSAASLRAGLLYAPSPASKLPSPNPANDRWLGFDKVQHATFSFLWTLGSQYTLVNKISLSEGDALPISIGSAVVVGVSKELYDEYVTPGNRLSYRDLAADAAGIALATVLILL